MRVDACWCYLSGWPFLAAVAFFFKYLDIFQSLAFCLLDRYELFYFCHIHAGMSGRINVCDRVGSECKLRSGQAVKLYDHYVPGAFDQECGTTGVEQYKDGKQCTGHEFLCASAAKKEDTVFKCFDAIDCAMNAEMRVDYNGKADQFVTFLQQMIPHHQNAVNMAKCVSHDGAAVHYSSCLTLPRPSLLRQGHAQAKSVCR